MTLRYLCVHQFLVDVVPGVDSLYHATLCGLKRSRLALLGNHGLQATGLYFLAGGLRIVATIEVDAHLLGEQPKSISKVSRVSPNSGV
jgi:hypothetical protein